MNHQLDHSSTKFHPNQFPIVLVCDQVNSPANIGSIFRIADSFGVNHIYFCGENIRIMSNRMFRTSRSTHKHISYSQPEKTADTIKELAEDGYHLFALEITENSIPIDSYHFDTTQKVALIIGDENLGISDTILGKVTKSLHIPMFGINSSMNVAMAAGIALYEITKQMSRN